MRIGREGSTDRAIVLLNGRGLYASFRIFRARGFHFAFGPGYKNNLGLRP